MERDRTENQIELSLTAVCNVMCVYCPQKTLRRAVKRSGGIPSNMTLEEFGAILGNVDRPQVHIAGFTEPFQNPQCAAIVEMASRRCNYVAFYSTGAYATDEDIDRIGALPNVDKVWHLPKGDDPGEMPGLRVKANRFREKIEQMENSTIMSVGVGRSRKVTRSGWTITEAGGGIELDRYPVKSCKRLRERRPVVLPGGLVVACCNDYGLELVIGNLLHQTYDQLDFGSVLEKFKTPQDIPCFRGCHLAKLKR